MVGGAGGVGAASGGCHEVRQGLWFGTRAGRRAGAWGWREAALIVYLGVVCLQYGAFGSLRVLAGWPVCGSGVLLGSASGLRCCGRLWARAACVISGCVGS